MARSRRGFLKSVVAGGLASQAAPGVPAAKARATAGAEPAARIDYPRTFTGRRLSLISFPLGGIGAGSLGLGGRGQLRDWQIFNRSDKGHSLTYSFPAIFVETAGKKTARVLESRILPPYEGASGLGAYNVPGLPRLDSAVFRGEFPLARIDFEDASLPVSVWLEAFTPFIPLEADDSGLPVAILRYGVKNTSATEARVGISYSIDSPVGDQGRMAEYRESAGVAGLLMRNPFLTGSHTRAGSFVLAAVEAGDAKLSHLTGWQKEGWSSPALLFWDDFSADGELGPEPALRTTTGSVCLTRSIAPGASAAFTFLLAWHFPNRTPGSCGWAAANGEENTVIGNHYATRFADAWKAAGYAAERLPELERRTRLFAAAMRETTLPGAVVEAATANLSTLVTPTCFRAGGGRFHGFEGTNDHGGCCHGTCNHVWNYEVATQFLFPSLSRSMRESAFGFRTAENGLMDMREYLPFGKQRQGLAAADGQMGQIMKLYLDWRLSGDTEWLEREWPGARRALEFAWIPGGWDADRDGVMEGVQHNTYDVEFYGPNPLCGIWYLGALRAGEEMARACGEQDAAREYRRLFDQGSRWIDANLFNGEYYVQKVRGVARERVAPGLIVGMGATDTENPTYQLGDGCLIDQLLGQYMADIAGLGDVVDAANVSKTLRSLWKYNYKPRLANHEGFQRVYALNDEAGFVICDYGRGKRPRIPFPYFSELMTGFEYAAAVLMLYRGMLEEGVAGIASVRRRFDGERRNPWDEAECGHNYARAMASWAAVPALSGFAYDGVEKSITARPRWTAARFASVWSCGTAWGVFRRRAAQAGTRFSLVVHGGTLACRSASFGRAGGAKPSATLGGKAVVHRIEKAKGAARFVFEPELSLKEGDELVLVV